jgi:putative (di)nucleoside polyphosphate hydrolase
MKQRDKAQFFRAGVGAVIVHPDGRVLAFERSQVRGAWQFPQGGLEHGEEPAEAVFREVAEETGIGRELLEELDRHPQPLAYELPPIARRGRLGRGQVHYWYLLRFTGDAEGIRLPVPGEFCDWKWMRMRDVVAGVVEFRRPVYRALAERFGPHVR